LPALYANDEESVRALFGADGGGRRGKPGKALELSFGNSCGFMKTLDQWRRAHSEFDGNAPYLPDVPTNRVVPWPRYPHPVEDQEAGRP
jgi:hypothetical protein